MKKNKLITIIIPLYNEEESISTLYLELKNSLNEYNYEIIFINDGSSDNSKHVIRDIIKTTDNISVEI